MSRFARKVDSTHAEIVDGFRASGCSVLAIQSTMAGCPDLLVGICGRTHLVECKPPTTRRDGKQSPKSSPRAAQRVWAGAWKGSPVHVVHDAAEAVALANLLRMSGGLRVVRDVDA